MKKYFLREKYVFDLLTAGLEQEQREHEFHYGLEGVF